MPAISTTVPESTQTQILEALVGASFILHSGGKQILDFTKRLFGSTAVNDAVDERKEDEKMVGMNGGLGEGGACTSLTRAYVLLKDHGEDGNARELKEIIMGRFLKDQFQGEEEKVRAGW